MADNTFTELVFGERIIGYYTALARAFNSISTAVFVSEIVQLTNKDGSSWVTRSQDEWDMIGLKLSELKSARNKLKKLGLLEEKRQGSQAYRISASALSDFLAGKEVVVSETATKQVKDTKAIREENLRPLYAAFKSQNIMVPNMVGRQKSVVLTMLKYYSPDDIAGCWRDIHNGTFGYKNMDRYLSFGFMAKYDLIEKWKTWSTGGRRSQDNFAGNYGSNAAPVSTIASREDIEALDR